jgi:hypothetical protein
VAKVGGRAAVVVHVEATPFADVAPSAEDVEASLAAAWGAGVGVDVYDDRQLRELGLLGRGGAFARVVEPWREALGRWARQNR